MDIQEMQKMDKYGETIPTRQFKEERFVLKRFKLIKKLFFPRWDPKGQWKIGLISSLDLPSQFEGVALKYGKLIYVTPHYGDITRLDHVIIHEIVHGVTQQGHTRKWNNRMAAAAKRAAELGRKELSELIKEDYQIKQTTTPKEVYNRIRALTPFNPYLWAYEKALSLFIEANNCSFLPIFQDRLRFSKLPGKTPFRPDLELLKITDTHYFCNALNIDPKTFLMELAKYQIKDPIDRIFDEIIYKLYPRFRCERKELLSKFPDILPIYWNTVHQNLE